MHYMSITIPNRIKNYNFVKKFEIHRMILKIPIIPGLTHPISTEALLLINEYAISFSLFFLHSTIN